MNTHIAIIGAGSAVFSLNLIRDICLTPNLRGSSVTFMDISPERLEGAYTLCKRYAAEVGIELELRKTTERREALRGADIVVNAALVPGHSKLREGWVVAREHGYRYGGSLRVMHDEAFWINFYQLRLFDAVMEDLLEICPAATYVQVANPVFAGITHLARRYPQARIVGLCHGFNGVYHLAEQLGLGHEGLTFEVPGVNHFVWLTKMYHNGEDVFPLLDRWIAEEAPRYWQSCGNDDGMGLKAVDLYRRFAAFPIGDTGSAGGGSWGWEYHVDDASEARWNNRPAEFWQRYFSWGERKVAEIQRIAADQSLRVTDSYPPEHSREVIVPLIESLVCDIPGVIIGNIPNSGGYVPGIPANIAVEVPLLVSKRGLQGVQTEGLPSAALTRAISDYVAPVDLELAAYTQRSRRLLLELLMLDPWTRSTAQAQALLDGILALPGHEAMAAYYQ